MGLLIHDYSPDPKTHEKAGILFGSKSWIRNSTLARRGAKATLFIGTIFSISGYKAELQAAIAEDNLYQELTELTGNSPGMKRKYESFLTASGGIVGEEVGGELGGAAGLGLGGLLGIETGPGAIITAAGGSVVGGALGDELGKRGGISVLEWLFR